MIEDYILAVDMICDGQNSDYLDQGAEGAS
jgi:hypothetical protein